MLFAFLLPGVGLLYLGYGYFIAHNDAHRAFFEYQPFMFYLSAMFPLILLRVETDAEYVLKVIVYSGLAYLPILLLQFFILKMTGIIFLPGVEDIGKEWLGATGRFVPDAQDVVLLVSIYLYWKVVRELNARNLIAAVLSVVALLLTYSRGLWLSYVIGFVFVSWHEKRFFLKRFHTLPLLAAACGAVVIFIYMSGLSDSILHRFGMMSTSAVSTDMSLKWRVYEIKEAIRAIEASPVIGHGLGYEYHRPFAFVSDSFYFHNNYLFLLVKMGLPGFLAMLAFIVVFIKTALAVYKEYAGNNLVSGVAIASAAYMTAMSFAVMARSAFVTTTNTVALISVIFG
ncbi:MAG: O-antigen ligase family protein, partial [Deltaproteobacteria bacterium]|nr:O-antigen ligase family protein [Deltaproteobacteria bacterium]